MQGTQQKNYNDVVVYVRNGAVVNALVLASALVAVNFQPEPTEFQKAEGLTVPRETRMEEHLTLVYLDPSHAKESMGSTEMDRATVRVIGVAPLVEGEGKATGWKDGEEVTGYPADDKGIQEAHDPPADESVRKHIQGQLNDGEQLTVPDGANLGRYFELLDELLHGVKQYYDGELKTANETVDSLAAELATAKANLELAHAANLPNAVAVEPKAGEPSAADLDAVAAG